MDDEIWAQKLAKEIQNRRAKKERQSQQFLAEVELKKAHAPKIWEEIRGLMKSKMEALNAALGEEALRWASPKSNEARIERTDSPRETFAWAEFNPESLGLEIHEVNTGRSYTPEVENGQVVFSSKKEGVETPDYIAARFIAAISKFL